MVTKDVAAVLDEIRQGQGVGMAALALRTGEAEEALAAFFRCGGEERLGRAAARALGLRADRFETCAGPVIDYYKSGIYFSSDEMQMIALFRRADAAVRERLLALLAAL